MTMVDKIKSFFKSNPQALSAGILLVIVATMLLTLQGCNLASFVKVAVPQDVKLAVVDVEYLDHPITLDEADEIWVDWNLYVTTNTNKLRAAIADAEDRYAVLKQFTDLGVGALGESAGGLPGGALLLSGLSLVTGLFLKRPGEDKRVAAEKEASYNKGFEVGSPKV